MTGNNVDIGVIQELYLCFCIFVDYVDFVNVIALTSFCDSGSKFCIW